MYMGGGALTVFYGTYHNYTCTRYMYGIVARYYIIYDGVRFLYLLFAGYSDIPN